MRRGMEGWRRGEREKEVETSVHDSFKELCTVAGGACDPETGKAPLRQRCCRSGDPFWNHVLEWHPMTLTLCPFPASAVLSGKWAGD